MKIKFSILASGSSGNSCFLKIGDYRFLIDVGISRLQIKKRLEQIGEDLSDITAIFISHDHIDHTRGLSVIQKYYRIPIYASRLTWDVIKRDIAKTTKMNFFEPDSRFKIDNIFVEPVRVNHDAVDPVGFIFAYGKYRFAIFTDLGSYDSYIEDSITEANLVVIETNYDKEMLKSCRYPDFLKYRIAGIYGHLSNKMAAKLVRDNITEKTRTLYLAHISENCNSPLIAKTAVMSALKDISLNDKIDVIATSRTTPTQPFYL